MCDRDEAPNERAYDWQSSELWGTPPNMIQCSLLRATHARTTIKRSLI